MLIFCKNTPVALRLVLRIADDFWFTVLNNTMVYVSLRITSDCRNDVLLSMATDF